MKNHTAHGGIAAHPTLLKRLAHAALAAEDDDIRAWARLSLVCRTFRNALQGVPVTVDFSGKSSAAKRRWLEETAVPVRRLVFHREGYSGALMLDDSCRALSGSEDSLEELRCVRVSVDRDRATGRHLQPAGSLARFRALQALTLKNGGIRGELPDLPPTIRTLVLDDDSPVEAQMARSRVLFAPQSAVKRLRLGCLLELRDLTLRGSWFLRHVCSRPLSTEQPPELPPSLTALRLEAAGDDQAIADIAEQRLEKLAQLNLLDIVAQRVALKVPAATSQAAGPRRLCLAFTKMVMHVSSEALLGVDRHSLAPEAQILEYLARLMGGMEEIRLSSCESSSKTSLPASEMPLSSVTFYLYVDGSHEREWAHTAESVHALSTAMQQYAVEHGFSTNYDCGTKELVLWGKSKLVPLR